MQQMNASNHTAGCCSGMHRLHQKGFGARLLWVFIGIAVAYAIVWMGTLIRNNIKKYDYIGRSEQIQYSMSFSGKGKVTATPNIALLSVGFLTIDTEVSVAQAANTKKMNAFIVSLKKEAQIAEVDIQTQNYSVYPKYTYNQEEGEKLQGYAVDQQVQIKIRDLTRVGSVLSMAGRAESNKVSGISFTIDEIEGLRRQARIQAIEDARTKAEEVARMLGVRLGKVISFSEMPDGKYGYEFPLYAMEGRGGGGDVAPTIQPGQDEVLVQVDVTFEIL